MHKKITCQWGIFGTDTVNGINKLRDELPKHIPQKVGLYYLVFAKCEYR